MGVKTNAITGDIVVDPGTGSVVGIGIREDCQMGELALLFGRA
jgi:hypothetical protein